MKCGTSSLHQYLGAHPDVSVPPMKETDFFLEENDRNLDWYRSLFEENEAAGEASPNYTKYPAFPGVPKRIRRTVPDVKLIYVVRDPLERMVSHYVHNVANGRETKPIDDALTRGGEENHYLVCSKYFAQLERYREHFNDGKIKVVPSRELKDETRKTMRGVFDFLGVNEAFYSEAYEQKHHRSSEKKSAPPLVRRMRRGLSSLLPARAIKEGLPDPATKAVKSLYSRFFESPVERPSLNDALRARLAERLADDVNRLRQYTGRAFASWAV
jgi:hypothetical protein